MKFEDLNQRPIYRDNGLLLLWCSQVCCCCKSNENRNLFVLNVLLVDVQHYGHVHLLFLKWTFIGYSLRIWRYENMMVNVDNLESDFTLFHYLEMSRMCFLDGLQENWHLYNYLMKLNTDTGFTLRILHCKIKNASFRIQNDIYWKFWIKISMNFIAKALCL